MPRSGSLVHGPTLRRLPGVRIVLAQLLALCALGHLSLTTVFILRDDWASWVSMAWLEPGARILSLDYALFLLTSAIFVLGGALSLSRPSAGLLITGFGFLFSLTCFLALRGSHLAKGDFPEAFLASFFFFILPAWWFASGGIRAATAPRMG